jgi:tetratricopeptide (TPR) repeat protein
MPAIPNIEAASNGGFLWPSLSDAVDTFLRRRHNNADPYERVWRLIHLWEAMEISLGLAAMSWLIGRADSTAILRRQREFFYGKTWDQVTGSFKSMQGAGDGTVDQWINIIDEVAKAAEPPGAFLLALKKFLTASAINMGPLLASWAKACDVPSDFRRSGEVEVRTAMRYVNSFRNRLAHVPFPHDPLEEVADALEAATEQLFAISPLPTCHEKNGESSALTGAFRTGRFFLHGGNMDIVPDASTEEIQFVFPCRKRGDNIELWSARSMLHMDAMTRPHILTRLKGHDLCEYTRFRAEANAVLVQPDGGIAGRLLEPTRAEYMPDEEAKQPPIELQIPDSPLSPKRAMSMSDAIEAIRSDDFDSAIPFFEELARERPNYHIGWLRLGYARREKAVRLANGDTTEAIRLLNLALSDLSKAAEHVDPEYQAQALYERSKTAYHLARLFPEFIEDKDSYLKDAEAACSKSDEKRFLTWLEHIQAWPTPAGGKSRPAE